MFKVENKMPNMILFDAGLRERVLNSRFMGVTTFRLTDDQPSLWWCHKTRRWVTLKSMSTGGASTHAPCRSYKAFQRHLRKHTAVLQGYDVVLVSCFVDHNVTARVFV